MISTSRSVMSWVWLAHCWLPFSSWYNSLRYCDVVGLGVNLPGAHRLYPWASMLLGAGILSFVIGELIWGYHELVLEQPTPFPSWADAAYLSAYPLLLTGILLLSPRSLSIFVRTRVILDGALIMAVVATFSWYFYVGPIIATNVDSFWSALLAAAYPLGDLMLVACLIVLLRSQIQDPALRWVIGLLTVGLSTIIVADYVFLYQTLHGGYLTGNLVTDLGWLAGYMLVGVAARTLGQESHDRATISTGVGANGSTGYLLQGLRYQFLPYMLLPMVGVLFVYTWLVPDNSLTDKGVLLGSVVVVGLVVTRQIFVLVENGRLHTALFVDAQRLNTLNDQLSVANAHLEALATTDPLTELPNHRATATALNQEIERAHRYGRSLTVLLVDLDHFKAVNDTYGHAAGDLTLSEAADVMRGALRGTDIVGRWGGEEFLIIIPEADDVIRVAERIRSAVANHRFTVGGGTYLTCSIGLASIPDDAGDRDELLELADNALFIAKLHGRNQVRTAAEPAVDRVATRKFGGDSRETETLVGTVEALLTLIEARDHYTFQPSREIAALARRLALAMGMTPTEAHMLGLAARLYDIGKVVVPDAVLRKPAPLTEEEWAVMRTHPLVGADVVSHIPTLRSLAPLIRGHHERWDGTGYPAGLAGEAIPLGARILAVIDAYCAITSDRPYRPALSSIWALSKLRDGAGTQFDPEVVAALERVFGADPSLMKRVGDEDEVSA